MSKGDGLKIGIKFTEEIIGNIALIGDQEKQDGTWTANGAYSSSPVANAKDGNTATYWESRSADNYVQIVRPNTKLIGIKVYKGASYRPSNFKLSKSSDGTTYTEIKTGTFVAATEWETVLFDEPVDAGYFRINFGYTTRLYLYELALIVAGEFLVTGKEYKYVNGPLIKKIYKVTDVQKHPTENKSILLTLDWWGKFNNVEGKLKIEYDAAKGTLTGSGGAVESFEEEFTPADLVQTPNPGIREYIKAYPYEIDLTLSDVEYVKNYPTEYLKAYPYSIVLDLKDIGEINP